MCLENNDIQIYEDSQSIDDIFLQYDIIETSAGKEIIFGDFTTHVVKEIYYVIDSELPAPSGQNALLSNKERRVDLCSQNTYDAIDETELLYEYHDDCVHYYKQPPGNDKLYRKIVIYNTDS